MDNNLSKNKYPLFVHGRVQYGYQNWRELGFPTANLRDKLAKKMPACFDSGIYYGWGKIANTKRGTYSGQRAVNLS